MGFLGNGGGAHIIEPNLSALSMFDSNSLAMGCGEGEGRMREGGTHFWQAPTALDLPPHKGGAQLKRHPPTHRLTNAKEKLMEKFFWRREYSPFPSNHRPTLAPPPPGRGSPIRRTPPPPG